MRCTDCSENMKLIGCMDSPSQGLAYNIFHCEPCMMICKANVWDHKGQLWIDKNDQTKGVYNSEMNDQLYEEIQEDLFMGKPRTQFKPLTLVQFTDEYKTILELGYPDYPALKERGFVYLGEVPNMLGHAVLIGLTSKLSYVGFHITDFEEMDEDKI